jgi:hypothetical protein
MSEVAVDSAGANAERLRRTVTHPWKFKAFLGAKLPLALMAGLRVPTLTADTCVVTVPYGWRTTNPFRSTYFAAQAMAAEMSTGALGLAWVEASPVPVSMLIVGMTASFSKKASETLTFTCVDGAAVAAAVRAAVETGESQEVTCTAEGRLPSGEVASRFTFTWSFKRKRT